jgi:hypothetical protein
MCTTVHSERMNNVSNSPSDKNWKEIIYQESRLTEVLDVRHHIKESTEIGILVTSIREWTNMFHSLSAFYVSTKGGFYWEANKDEDHHPCMFMSLGVAQISVIPTKIMHCLWFYLGGKGSDSRASTWYFLLQLLVSYISW